MGWDGAGGFNRQRNFSADESAGIKILASAMDEELNDFASAITVALTRDGQNEPSDNLPMGGNRHVNVAAATSATNYLRAREFITQVPIYVVDQESGSTTNVSVSVSFYTTVSANAAPPDGAKIVFRAASDKSASCAFHLNAGGGTAHSANIYNASGGAVGNFAFTSGGVYELIFNSAFGGWQAINPNVTEVAGVSASDFARLSQSNTFSTTQNIDGGLSFTNNNFITQDDSLGASRTVFGIQSDDDFLVGNTSIDTEIRGLTITLNGVSATDFARQSQTNEFTSNIQRIVASSPSFRMRATGNSADEQWWLFDNSPEGLRIRAFNDDLNTGESALTITRSAETIDTVNFPNGTLQYGGTEVATIQTGSFSGSLDGFATSVSADFDYTIIGGNLVTIHTSDTHQGTSNASTMVFRSVPAALQPVSQVRFPMVILDGGVTRPGFGFISEAGGFSKSELHFAVYNASADEVATGNCEASSTKGLPTGFTATWRI